MTGGYRAMLPGPVMTVLESLEPDALEGPERCTLRSLGRWGSRHGVTTVMISHERLDRLTGQLLPSGIARRVADYANRRTAEEYDTVLCTTQFAREEFDRIGVPNVLTVPLGWISTCSIRGGSPPWFATAGRPPSSCCWCTAAGSQWEKRADRSIDTLAALRDSGIHARLVIAGEGPLRNRLERHAIGLPVDFTGFIDSREAVAALLASADVALAPGPHETFGLAALEALACGTPAVVSATSALREILTSDSGAWADNNPGAIAAAVTRLRRPEHQRRLDARRRAERFTWPSAAHGMLTALGAFGV